jgi:uncharacterized protein (TIGR02599 family)
MMRVIIVAIDEKSAAKLEDAGVSPIAKFNLNNVFAAYATPSSAAASSADDAQRDLANLEDQLTKARVSYRVFSTDVSIMQAKWSE